MSFITKEWKDRLVEFAGRRKLRNIVSGAEAAYDVWRAEGNISQNGDAFSAANMNELEQRIKNEFDSVSNSLNNVTGSVLWKNPSPTAAVFDSKNIELSNSEYDFLEIFHTYGSERLLKGKTTQLKLLGASSPGGGVATYYPIATYRTITYVSDTNYRVDNCYSTASYNIVQNNLLIPLYVVGYKTNIFK